MGYASRASIFAGAVAALFAVSAQAAVIDTFVGPQSVVVLSGGANPKSTSTEDAAVGAAIGNVRLVTATRTSGSGLMYADINAGLLSHGTGPSDAGIVTVSYDGNDDNAFNPAIGLGGVDLTDGGLSNGLNFLYRADQAGGVVSVTLYSGAGNFSTGSFNAAQTGFDVGDPYVPAGIFFAGMVNGGGSGANPANVTGIVITINGSSVPALDLQLASVESGTVPEPASLGLIGLGALFLARRRK